MTLFPELSRYDEVAFDTETTGVTYNDRPVGLSVAARKGNDPDKWPRRYLRWGHRDGGNNCTLEEVQNWADAELNRPGLRVYGHNAPFDLRMAAYAGINLERADVHDTGFMAALLNELESSFALDNLGRKYVGMEKQGDELYAKLAERYGGQPTRKAQIGNLWKGPGDWSEEYAEFDAVLTLALARELLSRIYRETFNPSEGEHDIRDLYELETSLIPFHLKLHLNGVRAHPERARRLKAVLSTRYDEARDEWLELCGGRPLNPRSAAEMEKLFQEHDLPVTYTDKGNPSFTKDRLKTINHPVPQTILRLKRLDHYRGTFVDSYILDNIGEDGKIHGEFHPLKNGRYGTVSGRYSSGGALNLQNIPSRDPELAPMVRGVFIPEIDGYRWAKLDYSQIEFRYFAHYAGGDVLRAYQDDPDTDFHQACADLAGMTRDDAKNLNFGILFGMGRAKLCRSLGVEGREADEFLERFTRNVPDMRRMFRKAMNMAGRRGYIRTWGGRVRRFRRGKRGYKNGHIALNALCQGSAADLIKKAMSRVAEIVDWGTLIPHLTVHDELDFSVDPGAKGMKLLGRVRDAMEDPGYQTEDQSAPWYKPRVPIKVDAEIGPDWGHTEDTELRRAA